MGRKSRNDCDQRCACGLTAWLTGAGFGRVGVEVTRVCSTREGRYRRGREPARASPDRFRVQV
jgi:hypothetical protein